MAKSKSLGTIFIVLFTVAMVVTIVNSLRHGQHFTPVLAAAGLAYVYGFYTGESLGSLLRLIGTVLAILAAVMNLGLL